MFYKKGTVNSEEADDMMKKLGKVKHDKSSVFSSKNYFAGCYQLFINEESVCEELPFDDIGSDLVLNADVILFNREELITELMIKKEKNDLSDSQLVLLAYKKWNTACVDHLVGHFAIVVWDRNKQELFIARDHTGKKTFYYYNSEDVFVFSSLMEPIFEINQVERKLNDIYIADFLSIISVRHDSNPINTIYEDILQLPAAHTMSVSKNSLSIREYWRVQKNKKIKYASNEEYEEAFRKLFRKVVKSRIRTNKNIGISLSGGLDSTSVACYASEELKKQGKLLYSYTQVPMKGYINYIPENKLADETEYVQETVRYTGNILPKYIDSEGKNMYTEIDRLLDIYEQPYKIFENATWLKEIQETANLDGCKILLNGQSGNATISWGDHGCYMQYLLKSMKFVNFYREVVAYSKLQKRSAIKYGLYNILTMSYTFTRILNRLKIINKMGNANILSPINTDFHRKMNTEDRLKKLGVDNNFLKHRDSFGERCLMLNLGAFSHLGAVSNKMSMYTGVEISDPTGDKRIIDFCMNLPENQWVSDGRERRLIKLAMKDSMPDKIRLNETIRGKQAADIIQRIIPQWEEIRKEMLTIGDNELERKYLNIPLIKELLNKNRILEYNTEGDTGIRLLLRALIFTRFIRIISNKL
jgi:Asparagine synthase (glutamine-hydrolyzing)